MKPTTGREAFEMLKKHHHQTFEQAVREKKADPKIISLCSFVNAQPAFFSASSCSGRIVILELNAAETKRESAFAFKKHASVTYSEIWKRLHAKSKSMLWLKQEPFILHLGTDSLENANRLLACAHKAGIKRGGIMVAKPTKFLLEFIGTHGFAVPVKQGATILVTQPFVKKIVSVANQKLATNFSRLEKFETILRNELEKNA